MPTAVFELSFNLFMLQINENGLVSFMTEVPSFYNVEFPMDYPIIAPFYADVDIRKSGQVSILIISISMDYLIMWTFGDQDRWAIIPIFLIRWRIPNGLSHYFRVLRGCGHWVIRAAETIDSILSKMLNFL
jgi:hypothetical protein